MNCEIITIGDELLIGQVIDTNSAWMATRLNEAGIRVKQMTSVSDDPEHITKELKAALNRSAIVLITGGLGPTKDDLTKDTLCRFFNTTLIEDAKVVHDLSVYFKSRGRELTETNRKQAEIPANCTPVYNKNGTAPGMWFDFEGKVIVSMPGVPYEMKAMLDEIVIPKLSSLFQLPKVSHQTIITTGVGESFLSDLLEPWETRLPPYFKLAYLPSTGMVRLRLSCYQSNDTLEVQLMEEVEKAKLLIGKYIYGYNDDTPEKIVGKLLIEKNQTLAVAESCTGGYVSHLITSVPGSSTYYIGSTISYANEVKTRFLGVSPAVIAEKGAVSEEVAKAMAEGVRSTLGSTWAISTTGIAGPGGGTAEKPVGTVWIGLAGPNVLIAKKFQFGNDRLRNIQITAISAFSMLRKEILGLAD
ncbi:MAG: competence/damage-inducible protein A [Bacteroidetes bacterium]|nr:competence/damage-inducible protein A [Bacteroidota bacterium]